MTILLSFLLLLGYSNQSVNELNITVENIKDPKGQLIVAIFNSKENYLKKPFESQTIAVKHNNTSIKFKDLPQGQYSVSIIYDENNNGELDKNFFGIPTEGFGFSKKSMGTFGPPSYDDTKIELDGDVSITISLKYF
ncbi:DUF2141 domain-containing protein [Fulvivirga sp. 29W222]|uniref:DUF2141 domain-containing protein n=1 Tax=Fulvivirga marina TaxID=2494733 RepID=A0A937KEB5_9BACT|nr:DUF2141 domain-containing protein [Fulvivirga marina]MBL6446945.1 DUF2141 domain-containing protein [Fulvivirga marina]